MHRSSLLLAASVSLAALVGAAQPACAGKIAFASPDGDSNNDCVTAATPCREIFQAIDHVDAGGTVYVAPGEYAAFGVDESMNIISDAGPAIVGNSNIFNPTSTTIGVTVNASDKVLIRGFVANAGVNAISIAGGGTVTLENCTFISALNLDAINYFPSAAGELYVFNSRATSAPGTSSGTGVRIAPTGSSSVKVVLENVRVEDNAAGLLIDGTGTNGTLAVTVRNSTLAGGNAYGVFATESGTGSINAMIEGSTIANNGSHGVLVSGASATVRMRDSTVTGNGFGIMVTSGGKIVSQGGNVVAGNTGQGTFTQTLPQQ